MRVWLRRICISSLLILGAVLQDSSESDVIKVSTVVNWRSTKHLVHLLCFTFGQGGEGSEERREGRKVKRGGRGVR